MAAWIDYIFEHRKARNTRRRRAYETLLWKNPKLSMLISGEKPTITKRKKNGSFWAHLNNHPITIWTTSSMINKILRSTSHEMVFRNSENFIISIKLEIFWRSSVFWANRDWNVISLMLLPAIKIVKTPDSDPSQSFYIEHTTKTIRKHHHKTPVYLKTF